MRTPLTRRQEQGFSLLEIILTIAILVSMTIATTTLMRSSIDIRFAIGQNDMATHRLSSVTSRIAADVEHAFLVALKDDLRGGSARRASSRGIFQIESGGDTDKLRLTTSNHRAMLANSSEGDTVLVVYEIREDKKVPGRKNLYRGETRVIPEDLREDPPLRLFATNIKAIRFKHWNGDDWSKDRWDSTRGDWRDKLPRMVMFEVEAWAEDAPEGATASSSVFTETKTEMLFFKSAVYLPMSLEFKELKDQSKTIKYF